jgi:hypothetical protein
VSSHIAAGQVKVRRVRREIEQLRIGHRHAFVYFVRILDHFRHMIMETGEESHLTRGRADGVEALAHGLERGLSPQVAAIRRKHNQVIRSKVLQELHRRLGAPNHFGAFRWVVRGSVERDRNDLALALTLLSASGGCDVVGLEYLGKLSESQPDKPGIRITSRISVNGTRGK